MARDAEIGTVTVGVVPDATGIEQKLRDQIVPGAERVGEEAGSEMSDAIESKMDEGGSKSADKFGKKFRTRLKAALDNLPPAKVEGDVTDVDRKLAEVAGEIKALHDEPLIDKNEAARSLDQIMLKVAALKAEAATGVDIPVSIDTRSALADLDTAIQKIRGKAVTGALVPGGMFPSIPFTGSATEKVLAAAQQQMAASVPGLGMNDIFIEARALQAAKEIAAASARPTSFAGIPLAAGEAIGDISGATAPARAQMFAASTTGMADIIHGVIGEVMSSSPWGDASFIAGMEGVQKAAFSMSKEVELFRKPVGDLVRYTKPLAGMEEQFAHITAGRYIAPDYTGRRSFVGGTQDARQFVDVLEGIIHPPGADIYGQAGFAAGTDGETIARSFSTEIARVEKPLQDIVKYQKVANNIGKETSQELVLMSDFIKQQAFQAPARADSFLKKLTDSITKGFSAGRGRLAGGLRGLVGRGGAAEPAAIPEDVISAMEKRMGSGVPVTGTLGTFMRFMQSPAAKALGTPGVVTPDIISAMEQRLTTGVPLTGELNKFARYIQLDAAQGVRRSLSDLIPMYGAGGGDVQKLLSEFGGGHKAADTATLLRAFGAGGGDLGKLLKDFGVGEKDVAGILGEGGGGGGGGGGILSNIGGFFSGLPGQAGGLLGKIPLAGGNPWIGGGIGAGVLAALPFIGQGLGGAGVLGMGAGLAGLGITGAIHGLSTATTPAQIATARQQAVAAADQVTSAQLKLNALQKSGTATAYQLSLAHQAVAAAQAQQTTATNALSDAIANKMTPAQTELSNALTTFSSDFGDFMRTIGTPFVPVLANIVKIADAVGKVMTPVFARAEGIIATAVNNIAGTLLKALGQPAVQKSILAVASAFSSLLNAMSPNIASGIGAIANSITNMANAVMANPKPFADFVNFLFAIVNAAIQTIAWLTRVADWIEKQKAFWGAISKGFDEVIGNIKEVIIWLGHFEGFWKGVWATAKIAFDLFMGYVKTDFALIGTAISVASDIIHGRWGQVLSDIGSGAKKVVPIVKTAFGQVSNAVLGALGVHHAATAKVATSHHITVATHLSKTQALFRAHAGSMAGIAAGNVADVASGVHAHAATHLTKTQNLFRAHANNMAGVAGASTVKGGKGIAGSIAEPFVAGWDGAAKATDAGIKDVGKLIHFGLASFDGWWKQHGTEVKAVWNALWNAVKNVVGPILKGIGLSIKIGLLVIEFAFKAVILVLKVAWTLFWDNVKGIAKAAVDILKGVIKAALDFIKAMWEFGWHVIQDTLRIAWDIIVGIINVALDVFTGHWKQAWNDIQTTFKQIWDSLKDIFKTAWQTLVTAVETAFGLLKTTFVTGGGDIIHGLFSGITGALSDIGHWIDTNIYQPIVSHIKSAFGIKSPASKLKPIGSQIITGIFHGMIAEGKNIETFAAKIFNSWPKAILSFVSKGLVGGMSSKLASFLGSTLGWVGGLAGSAASKAAGFFGKVFSLVSGGSAGGVARWASTVSKALTMLGLPQSLSPEVLYQMQTESGGNPNAINLWDSNARAGHPSQGLMQTIPSTFQAYHVAGTSWNILDPLANIAAALNYAKHNKGFGTGAGQIGSGHGYDTGGWLPTGVTLAMNNTGKPERILTDAQWMALAEGGGPEYHAHFDGLTTQAIQAEVRTAFHMMNLTTGQLARPGRRT